MVVAHSFKTQSHRQHEYDQELQRQDQKLEEAATRDTTYSDYPNSLKSSSGGKNRNTSNSDDTDYTEVDPTSDYGDLEALPEYFDLLLERDVVRSKQLERGQLQLKKKAPGYHLHKKVSDFQVLLGMIADTSDLISEGNKDKAIEMLLETGANNPNFYAGNVYIF